MKRFAKIYLEISNRCNLKCSFCPGTKRASGAMNEDMFSAIVTKIRPYTDFLYFHLMGEPLCHPLLERFLAISEDLGFKVIITTNGTLLNQKQDILLKSNAVHKVVISLHSFEANDINMPFTDYLNGCLQYAKSAENKKITVLRLWNSGGKDSKNTEILEHIKNVFPNTWKETPRGTVIGNKVFIQFGDKFDWPDITAQNLGNEVFCYGLRDQIGILCDGTVVPCCLDCNGEINLGNILKEDFEDILSSKRATDIYNGFTSRKATEELCKHCSYARRFK